MEWFIGVTIAAILIIGSVVALWWWRLASKIAPYKDELEKSARDRSKRSADADNVVVIPGPTSQGSRPPRA